MTSPQLWLARIDGVAGSTIAHRLDASERQRLQDMTNPEARHRRAVAWGLRRWALSRAHPAVSETAWRFEAGPFGKPELAPPFAALDLHQSVSYRGNFAAVLVSASPCGVDVEEPPAGLEAAQVVFSPQERLVIAKHAQPRERFLQHWVAKEAVLKLIGTGLGDQPQRLSLDLTADGREARVRVTPRDLPLRLKIRLWPLPDGYWVAAAFDGPAPHLQPRLVTLT